ncbi:MAG: DUF3426 domain-containing protein [Thermodesulfobacteriota bacterium]
MIITCPSCLTKFKLAEDRLPAGGAKARCSKCQHIFFISPEPAPPAAPREAEIPAAPVQISGPGEQKIKVRTPPKSSAARRGALILLIFLILAGLIYGLGQLGPNSFLKEKGHYYYSMLRSYLGLKQSGPGFISLEKIRSYYLENKHRQRIFVVEGEAVNRWPEPRSFIKVKGTLLDAQGSKIEEQTSYCGNILLEEDLKNFPPEAIEKSLAAQFGETFANVNIPPGKAIPFMIVFTKFYEDQASAKKISNFQVEVVSSQKGT